MDFSPQLEARFTELARHYPPGYERAALVPMLLYAQDEVGQITDELISEIASRLKLTTLQVEEVVSYYSMLRRQPAGRKHIQVCTNISCMLRGAEELVRHVENRLQIKTGNSTPDGRIYLKQEEECLAACCGAPMMMVDHIYYENLTVEKIDAILDALP